MKPTFNTISGEGVKVASLEFDTIGYFARSLEDLKLLTDVLSISVEEPPEEPALETMRVGFAKSPFWSSAGPGTITAMEKAAEILHKHGVQVDYVEFPDGSNDADILDWMFKVIFVDNGGVAFYNDYLMDTTKTKLDPQVRAFVDEARELSREDVRHTFDYYAALRHSLDRIAGKYSALITPSATDEAPVGLGDMGSPVFNSVWTVSSPAFFSISVD